MARNTDPLRDLAVDNRRRPEGWAEKHAEVRRRLDAYWGVPYTLAEHQALGLFQGTASDGTVIHKTRRISRDEQYVIDTDAMALVQGLTLNVHPDWYEMLGLDPHDGDSGADGRLGVVLTEGEEVWRRAQVRALVDRWARVFCATGDLHLEPMLDDGGRGLFAAHRPDQVEVYYDRHGLDLEFAQIRFRFNEPPTVEGGSVETREYRRILTRDEIVVEIDGKRQDDESGPHTLGVVPLVHVSFASLDDPSFGLPATHGMDYGVALYNSALTMASVIGGRNAQPLLKLIGAAMDTGDDNAAVGRVLELPTGSDASFLEAGLAGIRGLVEMATAQRQALVEATPEFMFTDAGLNASGTALSYRAGAFKGRIAPARMRFHAAMARATSMAIALENGERMPEDAERYEVTGGPVLPEDASAVFTLTRDARDAGMLTGHDAVRRLQAVGLVPPTAEPMQYAQRAAEEANERDRGVMALVQGLDAEEPDETDDIDE